MGHLYRNPSWIDRRLLKESKLDDIPQALFDEINRGLTALQFADPFVSIVIPVLNEETTILRTLHSLSKNRTSFPTEVIVVNNNSTDRTQEVLDRLNVRSFFQPKAGWGPARQLGQENARGRYILMADADCFYPPQWIQKMTTELEVEGVTCVYGGYSFLAHPGKTRLNFFIYESLRNVIGAIRHIRRPWFNCVGMCMGYVKELGLKIGFVDRKIRGEDGRMCFDLARHGRIVRVRSKEVVVWTFPRTLEKEGSLLYALLYRAVRETTRLGNYLKEHPAHDTHTSNNFSPPTFRYFKKHHKNGDDINT